MKRLVGNVAFAWFLAFVALGVLATRAFHPYHRVAAGGIYAVSWVFFLMAFRNKRKWLRAHAGSARSLFRDYGWHIAFSLFVVFFLYVVVVLVPLETSPIADLDDSELSLQISQDVETLLYLDLSMVETLQGLERQTEELATGEPLSTEERKALRDSWKRFVEASFEVDLIKQRHKTFAQVNGFVRPKLHAEVFLLAYGAFLTQYVHALSLQSVVGENEALATLLNEVDEKQGIPANTYFRLKQRVTRPNDILRLNAGRGYLEIMRGRLDDGNCLVDRVDEFLGIIDGSLGEYPELVMENPMESLEKMAFDTWFPLQKGVALNLSYVRMANRDYLISPQMIAGYGEEILPGDILLERREWHATNIGIPGFWTHAAMYVGTKEQWDAYFADLPELEGSESAAEYVKGQFPKAYAALQGRDGRGHAYSIIEAKRPGVIFTSLEESGNADSIAVLRPRVSKSGRLHAVMTAFSYLGKPYDYNFDFRTDNEVVCSELIYKAYEGVAGLTLTPEEINGRPMLPPNRIGKKFDDELGLDEQELDLVLFLDGNEVKETAVERDEDAFRGSWQRPKWHILKDYALGR
jgi:hypothetical protein